MIGNYRVLLQSANIGAQGRTDGAPRGSALHKALWIKYGTASLIWGSHCGVFEGASERFVETGYIMDSSGIAETPASGPTWPPFLAVWGRRPHAIGIFCLFLYIFLCHFCSLLLGCWVVGLLGCCRSKSTFCCTPFAIYHLPFTICHSPFAICCCFSLWT